MFCAVEKEGVPEELVGSFIPLALLYELINVIPAAVICSIIPS